MFDRKFLLDNERKIPIAERLESKTVVLDNGCHEFTGGKDSSGYGRLKVGGHQLGAHKVSYLLNVGDFDQRNHELLHSCDNPACVNPVHLRPGTHRENLQECVARGRHVNNFSTTRNFPQRESIRRAATENGLLTYHGNPCQKHGTTLRSVVNGACMECREDYKTAKKQQRADAGRNWQWI